MPSQCTYNQKFWVPSQMWVPVRGAIPSLVTVAQERFIWKDTWNDLGEEPAGRYPREADSHSSWGAVTNGPRPHCWALFQQQTLQNKSETNLFARATQQAEPKRMYSAFIKILYYKNMYFLLSYISNTAKITLSIRTEGGTRVGVLDLTLAIIHTNSCPRILTLHNPIYTNMFL